MSHRRRRAERPKTSLWFAPSILGVASAVGLIAALLSEDMGDLVAWLTLAAPVFVVLWYARPRKNVDG